MADKDAGDTTKPGDGQVPEGGKSDDSKPTIESLTQELERTRGEKDRAARIARKHQERLESLEDKLAQYETDETKRLEGGKDKESQEQLVSKYKERVAALEKEAKEAKGLVRSHVLKDKIRQLGKDIINPDAFEDFFAIYGEKFELDAESNPIVSGEVDSVETFLREITNKKKHFSASRPAKGAGEAKAGGDAGGNVNYDAKLRELANMSNKERVSALAKDSQLRKAWATHRIT